LVPQSLPGDFLVLLKLDGPFRNKLPSLGRVCGISRSRKKEQRNEKKSGRQNEGEGSPRRERQDRIEEERQSDAHQRECPFGNREKERLKKLKNLYLV
jgi:hypothetical protein